MKRKPTGGTAVIGKPKANQPPPRVERVPVVVAVHPNGFIQVFGPREKLDVRIVNLLAVEPRDEALAEHYAELSLPRRHRAVFLPGGLVAMGNMNDCRTPEQEADRRHDLYIIRQSEAARKDSAA